MTHCVETRTELLRRAALQARLAPSVHNTQPWRFDITDDALEIHSDPHRQLPVLDPTGRQLLISCGCAVFNARVALAAQGYQPVVERFPDRHRPNLVARIAVGGHPDAAPSIGPLDQYVISRQTNRRRFTDEIVSPELVAHLIEVVSAEQAILVEVQDLQHRIAVARLSQEADRLQNGDPAYRAELRAWTTDDPTRPDGVPALAVPRVTGQSQDDLPLRDFDTRGTGSLPPETRSQLGQSLFTVATVNDDQLAWLQAGEALERLWLEITRSGYVASLFTQVIEVPYIRQQLRIELGLAGYPHVLVRVGKAALTPASMRRRLQDVVIDRTTASG
jgi:nitroreductase